MIYIIDELDRCKPLFALALLERIKHFMSVRNVHFVLGTHMRQLEASVRYAYGTEIDAGSYLQKFINVSIFNTEASEDRRSGDLEKYAAFLVKQLGLRQDQESPVAPSVKSIIRLSRKYDMSFRTLERAFTVLSLAVSFTPKNQLQLGALMGGLIMMKLIKPNLFMKAKKSTLTLAEASDFLSFDPDQHRPEQMGWEESWWTYVLAGELPKHLVDFGQSLNFRYHFDDRRDMMRYTANEVIDRLSPS